MCFQHNDDTGDKDDHHDYDDDDDDDDDDHGYEDHYDVEKSVIYFQNFQLNQQMTKKVSSQKPEELIF